MRGDKTIIAHLNRYLAFELTGIKQYLLHSRSAADQGINRLAEVQLEYSREEATHAARIMDRILFLEGVPALVDMHPVEIEQDVLQQLGRDQRLITEAIALLREGIAACEQVADFVSRDFLREMLDDEERHSHWIATQLDLAAKIGRQNYLQSQA